jgi:asparagine synthase (glutamine-hydrolysing)
MAPWQAEERITEMCAAILHRGPDSAGYFVVDDVSMGMRRLSIIDVAGGMQPISNEDGTVTVVFNGEIYNHHALRARLIAAGHTFKTHSDTEVLVHLYEDLGTHMVAELQGMFAFSIWDSKRKQLLLARDHTGMKPLSYMEGPKQLVWCSELRSLLAFLPEPPEVSAASVMQYLAFGYVPDPNSIFEGVRKLPPGHLLVWSAKRGIEIRSYWSNAAPDPTLVDEKQIVAAISDRLDKAVAAHLESEVPLGAFLSGGLDSSTVVALMTKHASGRVKTFTIGFAESEFDESSAARDVAQALGTEHTELTMQPRVEDMFEAIATMFDEPFSDSSAIPTFLVAQLARQSVTVALSGDGGDELFGGYTRYGDSIGRWSAPSPLSHLLQTAGRWLPHSVRGRNRLIDLGRSKWGQYAATVVQPVRADEGGIGAATQPGGMTSVAAQLANHLPSTAESDFAAAIMRIDLETYLPGDILTKVDRVTMAVSLEARVPLLDVGLIEYAQRIPGDLRVSARESKRLFRRAIKGLVPDSVLSRSKQGFSVPLAVWFRGPLRHRITALRTPSARLAQYIDQDAVNRLISEHLVARRDHSGMLWRLIVLEHWLDALHQGRLARPPSVPSLRIN